MGPALLLLALEFHRAPIRFRHLTDRRTPLPEAFGDWLVESSVALAPTRISDTAASLGTQPEALREAFLFLLRQVLLTPQADHYRVLGLSRGCKTEYIKRNYSLLVRMFHPDRLPGGDDRWVVLTARVNAAYHVLRNPEARERYDRSLPALSRSARFQGDPLGFFRARDPVEPLVWRPQPVSSRRRWPRRRLFWLLAVVPIAALVIFLLEEPSSPMLRVDPERADEVSLGPSYLRSLAAKWMTEDPAAVSGPRSHPEAGTSAQSPSGDSAESGQGRIQSTSTPSESATARPETLREGRPGPGVWSPAGGSQDSRANPFPERLPAIDCSPTQGPAPTGQTPSGDASHTNGPPGT